MTELQLGVVGLGARSTVAQHADRPGEGSVVVAVCDPVPAQRESGTANYPRAKAYPDHRDLLDLGLDGVFLTTPDHLHEEPAIDFLTAGVSVFVEKPLAITTEGCDRVLAAAAEHGTRLYVGHNMRHMPVVLTMRELIAARRDRRGQGDLVPALRRPRRRLLLQGLARRPDQEHQPAAAEGRARHRRDALAGRRLHHPGAGDGRPGAVRRSHRPGRSRRPAARGVLPSRSRTGRRPSSAGWRR